jgi:hypothetical protein
MCTAVEEGYFRGLTTQGHCANFVHCGHTGLQVFIVFFRILFTFNKYVRPSHDVSCGGRLARCPLDPRHTKHGIKTEWRRSVRSLICSSPRYIFFQLQGGVTLHLELRVLHFNFGCLSVLHNALYRPLKVNHFCNSMEQSFLIS